MFTLQTISTLLLVLAMGPSQQSQLLFDFEDAGEPRWQVVNDGVMGGRSKGFIGITDGTLQFWGVLVTRGGGFTSLRSDVRLDLSAFDGIEIRVRGSGRTFELEVGDGTRSGWRSVSRRAEFRTADAWSTVRIAFDELGASVFGRPVSAAPLDRSKIQRVGLFIADGVDGDFELEVDWIRAYAD